MPAVRGRSPKAVDMPAVEVTFSKFQIIKRTE